MSSPILPITGPLGIAGPKSTGIDRAGVLDFMSELDAGSASIAIEADRLGGPPEVLEQMGAAAGIYDELQLRGQAPSFSSAAPGARIAITLGERPLTIAEAFDLAAGKPAE